MRRFFFITVYYSFPETIFNCSNKLLKPVKTVMYYKRRPTHKRKLFMLCQFGEISITKKVNRQLKTAP